MRIANPIYDAVFKFFMEDPEVAKRLISNIMYFIQIQNLPETTQSLLLHRLSAFNQINMTSDTRWQLNFEDWHNIADPDLQLFVKRLWIAVQDQQVQEEVRAEQEIDNHFNKLLRTNEQQEQELLLKNQALVEKDQALAQAEQQKNATAKNLIALGISIADVARAMQANEAEVENWLKS